MKQINLVKQFQFDTFNELVDFLKNNPDGNRKVTYRGTGKVVYDETEDFFYIDEFPDNAFVGCTTLNEYFDEETKEPDHNAFVRDYDLNDFRGMEIVKEENSGKSYILLVRDHEDDDTTTLLFHSKEKALDEVRGDLRDRNHFDTNEPYCTEEKLAELQKEATDSILEFGWHDDGEVLYQLTECDYED